jgi:hypothetical protein
MINCNSLMYVASLMYGIKCEKKKNIFKATQFTIDLPNSLQRELWTTACKVVFVTQPK